MARLFPPVCHDSYTFGLKPCLSMRFQYTSHSAVAQAYPIPCGTESVPSVVVPYVVGLIVMSVEYRVVRMPGPSPGVKRMYGPIPRVRWTGRS